MYATSPTQNNFLKQDWNEIGTGEIATLLKRGAGAHLEMSRNHVQTKIYIIFMILIILYLFSLTFQVSFGASLPTRDLCSSLWLLLGGPKTSAARFHNVHLCWGN